MPILSRVNEYDVMINSTDVESALIKFKNGRKKPAAPSPLIIIRKHLFNE